MYIEKTRNIFVLKDIFTYLERIFTTYLLKCFEKGSGKNVCTPLPRAIPVKSIFDGLKYLNASLVIILNEKFEGINLREKKIRKFFVRLQTFFIKEKFGSAGGTCAQIKKSRIIFFSKSGTSATNFWAEK
jgi:hypothetical protein